MPEPADPSPCAHLGPHVRALVVGVCTQGRDRAHVRAPLAHLCEGAVCLGSQKVLTACGGEGEGARCC